MLTPEGSLRAAIVGGSGWPVGRLAGEIEAEESAEKDLLHDLEVELAQ